MRGTGKESATEIKDLLVAVVASLDPARISEDVWHVVLETIPELGGDPLVSAMMRASIGENVAAVLHVIEHGVPRDNIRAPYAAIESARRLAQHGIDALALVRTYRLGQAAVLAEVLAELDALTLDVHAAMAVAANAATVTFRYVDEVSTAALRAYQDERERWLLVETAARAGRVRELLRGGEIDADRFEQVLGYRLRQPHLGLVLWLDRPAKGSTGLERLRGVLDQVQRRLGSGESPLFVPRDEGTAWGWLPISDERGATPDRVAAALAEADPSVRVAVGRPAVGVEGFRASMFDARSAQRVALASSLNRRVTHYAEVATLALLCSDIAQARRWVRATLGGLSLDDENADRLRETLLVYLHTGSYRLTAEQQSLHRNSVQYRIRRAEEALDAPLEDRRADVELALRACQYLGATVLQPPGSN